MFALVFSCFRCLRVPSLCGQRPLQGEGIGSDVYCASYASFLRPSEASAAPPAFCYPFAEDHSAVDGVGPCDVPLASAHLRGWHPTFSESCSKSNDRCYPDAYVLVSWDGEERRAPRGSAAVPIPSWLLDRAGAPPASRPAPGHTLEDTRQCRPQEETQRRCGPNARIPGLLPPEIAI